MNNKQNKLLSVCTKQSQYSLFLYGMLLILYAMLLLPGFASASCIDDLSIRPKTGKIQLSWTANPETERYDIFRSQSLVGPYVNIASTDSTFAIYIDQSIDNGVLYYYQIEHFPNDTGQASCLSDPIAGLAPARRTRLTRVPDIIGQSQTSAEADIIAARLAIGTVGQGNHDIIPVDHVMSQDPPANSVVPREFLLAYLLSLGPGTVTTAVPDVVGVSQATAETAISQANLIVGTVASINSDLVPAGDIISQSPEGGDNVPEGMAVDLIVSLGSVSTTVPDVVGFSQVVAETMISNANLQTGTIDTATSNAVPAGNVISQTPVGGTTVSEGSAVDLVISAGPETVSVPDVVGLTQSAAESAILAAGLSVGDVSSANSSSIPVGSVISQDPAAGSDVPDGSTVGLLLSLGPADVDLQAASMDISAVTIDPKNLFISGIVQLEVANKGVAAIAENFAITVFEDIDANAQFDTAIDKVLGGTIAQHVPDPGTSESVAIAINSKILFKDNPILGFVDSSNHIQETSEQNNIISSIAECQFIPPVGSFDPVLEFFWNSSSVSPDSLNVVSTPAVADLNADGIADIIFTSTSSTSSVQAAAFGELRAISGDDGSELFTTAPLSAHAAGNLAVGDIDNDGHVEIVVTKSANRLSAFEHDGSSKWTSPVLDFVGFGGPSIADLDQDGTAEIIIGRQALNGSDGSILWTGTGSTGKGLSLVADVDMDGNPDVVAGNTVYNANGTILWQQATVPDGYNGVGNFDADPFPEIVVVQGGFFARIYLLEHDGSIKWGPVVLPNDASLAASPGGGPPTVADFDNDGEPEIGIAGSTRFVVYETDGSLKWQVNTQDISSGFTGASVFDFDGDGSAEVVYSDEVNLTIYRGTDGAVLFQTPLSSGTLLENPVIADVDNDGNAEIIAVANSNGNAGNGDQGVYVFGDANDTWVNARQIWNQHSYHVTNVNDDGSIPQFEVNNWENLNNYRQQQTVNPFACADVTAALIRTDSANCRVSINISSRVGNAGAVQLAPALNLSFYQGDPNAGGLLIETAQTAEQLDSGEFEDISVIWNNPAPGLQTIFVVADDDGTGTGQVSEIEELNNTVSATINICNQNPIANAGSDQSVLTGTILTLDGNDSSDADNDPINFSWSLISVPPASSTSLFDSNSATPSFEADVAGSYVVQLVVDDNLSNSALDNVVINAGAAVVIPDVTGLDQTDAEEILTVAGLNVSTETVSDPLVPIGEVVNQSPAAGTTQPENSEIILRISSGNDLPIVSILLSPMTMQIGESTDISVSATDNDGIASITLEIDGLAVVLDGSNMASFTSNVAGQFQVQGIATDVNGHIGSTSKAIRVQDPADNIPPQVTITSPGDGSVVSYLTGIVGTVMAPDLESYHLAYARVDHVDLVSLNPGDPDWQTFASGTVEINDSLLGSFDTTLLLPDDYAILLVAVDSSGNSSVDSIVLGLTGTAQLGAFSLEFIDLSMPLAGIPIEVKRRYSTFESQNEGDFGFGWKLAFADPDIRETVPVTPGEEDLAFPPIGTAFSDGTRIYLTDPDGKRIGFTFDPLLSPNILGESYIARFTADGGVYDELHVAGDVHDVLPLPLTRTAGGQYAQQFLGFIYNPREYSLVRKDGSVYHYHQFKGLQSITDRNGNELTFSSEGIQHSLGESIAFIRNAEERITQIIDPNGNSITYTYDSEGNLATITNQEGLVVSYNYLAAPTHYMSEIIDPLGRTAHRVDYTEDGRLASATDGQGNAYLQSWDPENFSGTITTAKGDIYHIIYNARGNVLQQLDPLGGSISYTYGDPANPDSETSFTDENNHTTLFTYDTRGNVLSRKNALNFSSTFSYNIFSQLTSVSSSIGHSVTAEYDSQGNMTELGNAKGDTQAFTYDAAGRFNTFTNFAGHTTAYEYDTNSAIPNRILLPDGSSRELELNSFGLVTRFVDEAGAERVFQLDNIGRQLAVVDHQGNQTSFAYTGHLMTTETNALGHVTQFEYDATDQLQRIIDPLNQVTTFEYDVNGNRSKLTDAVGNTTLFRYNALNRLIETEDTLGNKSSMAYDPAGNIAQKLNRNNQTVVFSYDAVNRLKQEQWFENATLVNSIDYVVDDVDNLLMISDNFSSVSQSFDALNQLTSSDTTGSPTGPAVLLSYDYDANGNRTLQQENLGEQVDTQYDNRDRPTTLLWQGPDINPASIDFAYNNRGDINTIQRYSDLAGTQMVSESQHSSNILKQLTSLLHFDSAATLITDYSYQFDAIGLVENEAHHGQTFDYLYDDTQQLTENIRSLFADQIFSYDANGNRTEAGQVVSSNNQLAADRIYTYTYDNEGNIIEKQEIVSGALSNYFYDHRNRLTHVEIRDGDSLLLTEASYQYDALNRRISKTVNGITQYMVYSGENVWADFDATLVVQQHYLFGNGSDNILANASGPLNWYLSDRLGSVHDLIDSQGNIVNHIDYDAFGSVRAQTDPSSTERYLFTGREFDRESGLYYYRARYYDPMLGRFISEDPIGFAANDSNLYRYVGNNPINATDPTGNNAAVEYEVLVTKLDTLCTVLGAHSTAAGTAKLLLDASAFLMTGASGGGGDASNIAPPAPSPLSCGLSSDPGDYCSAMNLGC